LEYALELCRVYLALIKIFKKWFPSFTFATSLELDHLSSVRVSVLWTRKGNGLYPESSLPNHPRFLFQNSQQQISIWHCCCTLFVLNCAQKWHKWSWIEPFLTWSSSSQM
jgi:hypothetical protein